MPRKQWNCFISLLTAVWMFWSGGNACPAEEGDARLRQRIAELEAENRSLRTILGEIQGVLESVPESAAVAPSSSGGLRIIVTPGDWGESELADIKKVCESAGGIIAEQLGDDGFAPILVQRNREDPITLYRRGGGNEYIVRLNTGDRAWAQLAFQFSHEFCHIVCNYRQADNRQLWFEETLCECASLYVLRQMSEEWKENPPYANWKSYSGSLASYAGDRAKKYAARKESVAEFYQANQAELEKTPTNRELNTVIAVKLLPLFEATPTAWQSLRYLNLGPAIENVSFQGYLSAWRDRAPPRHQPFIQQIAAEFEIELTSPARTN